MYFLEQEIILSCENVYISLLNNIYIGHNIGQTHHKQNSTAVGILENKHITCIFQKDHILGATNIIYVHTSIEQVKKKLN